MYRGERKGFIYSPVKKRFRHTLIEFESFDLVSVLMLFGRNTLCGGAGNIKTEDPPNPRNLANQSAVWPGLARTFAAAFGERP